MEKLRYDACVEYQKLLNHNIYIRFHMEHFLIKKNVDDHEHWAN